MRWAKRLAACKYADIGKTKLDELIDLDSVDQYFDSLPDAPLQKSEFPDGERCR
jgi:hypothetical protein